MGCCQCNYSVRHILLLGLPVRHGLLSVMSVSMILHGEAWVVVSDVCQYMILHGEAWVVVSDVCQYTILHGEAWSMILHGEAWVVVSDVCQYDSTWSDMDCCQ